MLDEAPATKQAVRRELAARRARLGPGERGERSVAIARRLETVPGFLAARTLAAYAPLGAEVDTAGVVHRALERGVRVLFPRAVPGDRRLAFAACEPAALVPGPHGALEPPPALPAVEPSLLDCVLLPGVAFAEDGLRLGRGGGHYDATLAALPRALRIGLAFDVQVVPALPREPHDEPLDAVVTEARTLLFRRDSR